MANSITDSLTLERVKQHLQVDVDVTEDDALIQTYMDNSLAYVTNYTQKTYEVYNNTETFMFWSNPLFLEWETEVRSAQIAYTDTLGATKTLNVSVYADNVIREDEPSDYNGGFVDVSYTPYIDQMQVPISHQARLLLIGDWYISRENTVMGTQVAELSHSGVNNLLNSIKLGFI